ncbi:hypothetical protein M5D96_002826 [Drosophila gunungcola]|uniref:Uncharacterized protein n=1 Tax=Drosophila gunungcola TaxID=103775 RepID=A0A9P9Z0N8_9MUSC|nr:hypothetical protein M5D96_002826 [Drosophila gunungcola]
MADTAKDKDVIEEEVEEESTTTTTTTKKTSQWHKTRTTKHCLEGGFHSGRGQSSRLRQTPDVMAPLLIFPLLLMLLLLLFRLPLVSLPHYGRANGKWEMGNGGGDYAETSCNEKQNGES